MYLHRLGLRPAGPCQRRCLIRQPHASVVCLFGGWCQLGQAGGGSGPERGQDTNIIFGSDEYGSVYAMSPVADPEESDPEQRYKSLYVWTPPWGSFGRHGEVRAAHSPDLIHWTQYEQLPELGLCGPHLNDVHIMAYDHQARQFVLSTRHYAQGWGMVNSASPSTNSFIGKYHPNEWWRRNNRRIWQTESSDFFHWAEPYLIMAADDEEDNIDDTFYGMPRYRAGNVWVGLLNVFHQVANTMDVQLAYSRDGKIWKRTGQRQPWITRGHEDAWDGVMASCCNVPLEVGDELWVYYGGAINHHDWWLTGLKEGLDARAVREGIIVTRPLLLDRPDESAARSKLVVNAQVSDGGYLQVEVTDAADKVLDGYSREDCDTFTGDEVRHEVTWQGKAILEHPQRLKLRFFMRNAALYSFQFAAPTSP